MRIDYEKREIACGVHDLVQESTYRRIGVERGDGFRRMWIGQEVHTRRAEECADLDPNYRPEVHVSWTCRREDWTITISGRMDGLSVDKQNRRIIIEEVKSLQFDLELAALYRSEKLQRHLYQLMLYAWFLTRREEYAGFDVSPQLVLMDILTPRVEIVPAPFDEDDVWSALGASLDALVGRMETARLMQAAKTAFADRMAFPFDATRPHQQEMIDAVARAVVQEETLLVAAPTGVGKTIAALFPAVRESLRRGKKLFFLTSKTLQQEIAVSTLRKLNDGSFRVLRIRAKQKMCANDEVICHEDFCPYAAAYGEKMQKSGLRGRISTDFDYFDPDVIFELAKETVVCPFEVSLELIEEADVIVCDYNYVFDPYVNLKSYQDENGWEDSIFIIDEAHNLVDRGRGYYSPVITEHALENVRNFMYSRGFDSDELFPLLDELQSYFRETGELLRGDQLMIADGDVSYEGMWPPAWGLSSRSASPETEPAQRKEAITEFNRRFFQRQRARWERLAMDYITWKVENRIAEPKDPLIDFYFSLIRFTNLLSQDGEEFAHLVQQGAEGLELKVFCKDPSKLLGETISSSFATIAISATLQPFDFYKQTLGFPRDRAAELAIPSPFPRENRKIVVVSDVDTTYKKRSMHYRSIADTVAEMAEATSGNFLALFPSYAFLREVADKLPVLRKTLMIQRSDMTDYERWSFLEALRHPSDFGNLILAVSGGMYAEGIDYAGEMLSGVFVVGPALPTVSFEQELLKQYYDEKYGAGFEYAYLIPGMTRVVQSAGRVIRSDTDIGVIALMCRRFTQATYNRYFPADWFIDSPRELVSKKPVDEIRTFFEQKKRGQMRMF